MENQVDITKAISQLQEILESKRKSLDEREESFAKRIRLFETSHPQSGKDTDVLRLNVGGSTKIAVLRRVLTQFEDSVLASMFSGRWDDSLTKDEDGHVFLDHDPDVFLKLINFLRMVDQKRRSDVDVPLPTADFEFCWLLEYYGLMLSVHPPHWCITEGCIDAVVQKPRRPNDPYVLKASHLSQSSFTLKLRQTPDRCASLMAVFEKGSVGRIGWGPNADVPVSISHSQQDQTVRMQCIYERDTLTYLFSVQLEDSEPVSFQSRSLISTYEPFIELSGSVAVSDLLYFIEPPLRR